MRVANHHRAAVVGMAISLLVAGCSADGPSSGPSAPSSPAAATTTSQTVAETTTTRALGGAPGVCSSLSIYPETGYAAIVLSNADGDCRAGLDFWTETPTR